MNKENKILKLVKKNKKITISLLALLLVGVVGLSYALFQNNTSFENNFKSSDYNVSLTEEFYDTWGTKKVSVVNNEESTDILLRINYDEVWSKTLDDDTVVTLSTTFTTSSGTERAAILNKPSDYDTNFIDGGDGWYYYTKVLQPNETVNLLESISLNENLKGTAYYEDYSTYDYQLSYNYEAIQATTEAAKKIWGYDITISESGEVTWPF